VSDFFQKTSNSYGKLRQMMGRSYLGAFLLHGFPGSC